MLDRNRIILACNDAQKKDVENLQNWVANTSSLAQDETAYLYNARDLMAVPTPQDNAVARLTPIIEKIVRSLYRMSGKVSKVGRYD